ncbi:MAG: DUF2817 domain-containing protein [Chloroflexi bacterium]|nr:DUF2817 domain-containing protein [Chloroflexota bacterium]
MAGATTSNLPAAVTESSIDSAPASSATSGAPSAAAPPPIIRDYAALVERVKAAARPPLSWRIYGQQVTPDGAERYDLFIVRIPPRPLTEARRSAEDPRVSQPPHFHVMINGGTHGDEPAGAEAVVQFLERRRFERWPNVAFTVMPCTNPWGYVHNRREGPGGVDLNRSFHRAAKMTREVSLLKRALRRRRFDLFLDCHEDVDAPGLYVFAPRELGRVIVAAAGENGPLHPGQLVDGEIPVKDSVVELDAERSTERRRTFKAWPLPFYIARYRLRLLATGSQGRAESGVAAASTADVSTPPETENVLPVDIAQALQATVETPTELPLDQRVSMHLAALDAAIEYLHSGQHRLARAVLER